MVDYLSQQRWADAETGNASFGLHEAPFDEKGNLVKGTRVLPGTLPGNPKAGRFLYKEFKISDKRSRSFAINRLAEQILMQT